MMACRVSVRGTVLEGRCWEHILIGYYELKTTYQDIEQIANSCGLSYLSEEKRQFVSVLDAYKQHLFGEKDVNKERGRLIQFLKNRPIEEAHCLERIGKSLIGRRLKKEAEDYTVYKGLKYGSVNHLEGALK
jgi:hypothetical protein